MLPIPPRRGVSIWPATDAARSLGNGVTCSSHTLQLVVRHAIGDGTGQTPFDKAIETVRNLVKFIRSRRVFRDKVRKALRSQNNSKRKSSRRQ